MRRTGNLHGGRQIVVELPSVRSANRDLDGFGKMN
jgi:hypothetical protein